MRTLRTYKVPYIPHSSVNYNRYRCALHPWCLFILNQNFVPFDHFSPPPASCNHKSDVPFNELETLVFCYRASDSREQTRFIYFLLFICYFYHCYYYLPYTSSHDDLLLCDSLLINFFILSGWKFSWCDQFFFPRSMMVLLPSKSNVCSFEMDGFALSGQTIMFSSGNAWREIEFINKQWLPLKQ